MSAIVWFGLFCFVVFRLFIIQFHANVIANYNAAQVPTTYQCLPNYYGLPICDVEAILQ
jgi:hypothetical protein